MAFSPSVTVTAISFPLTTTHSCDSNMKWPVLSLFVVVNTIPRNRDPAKNKQDKDKLEKSLNEAEARYHFTE